MVTRSDRLDHVHSDIRGPLYQEALRMESEGINVLKLNTGNPGRFGFKLPNSVRQALALHIDEAVPYCDVRGMAAARNVICTYHIGRGLQGIMPNDVFICNGGESETWVDDILDAAGESIGSVVHMMDHAHVLGEEFSEGMQGGHDHDEHAHDEHDGHDHDGHEEEIEYDEHIWTSPRIAMDLCRVIADTLAQADPAHAQEYQDRLAAYLRELTDLDRAFRDTVEAGQRHLLVFGDRFPLLYFCREYGLDYRAAFHGCSGDTEPSLATLKYLIDKVNQEDIPVVYTIELSSQKVANAIAETTGARVLTFHSCQTLTRQEFDGGETYLSLMWKNVDVLKEGLA